MSSYRLSIVLICVLGVITVFFYTLNNYYYHIGKTYEKPILEKAYEKPILEKTCEKPSSEKTYEKPSLEEAEFRIPSLDEIRYFQREPMPFKVKMGCKSYHEKNGISFERLWHWPSVRIFIGIWSTVEKEEIRNLIRTLYLRQKQDLIGDNVDFKFILGKSDKQEHISKVSAENDTYGDIVTLDIIENMNSGKAYYYWKWVWENFGATEYDYAIKTDDDSFVHFQNLALNLRPLPRDHLYYGHVYLHFVQGLLEVFSMDYPRLIASIPFSESEWKGAEDVHLAIWLDRHTTWTLNKTNEDCLIFNDPRIPVAFPIWRQWASPQSILIHWLKDPSAWESVVDFYFL